MTIQEKLTSLKPYVKSMRFYQDFPVIDATFKDKWKIPEGKKIKSVFDEKIKQYSFFSEDKRIGFDELLEYVEEIIKVNVDLEKKQQLYKEKNAELKNLFLDSNNKYEDLVNLQFILPEKEVEEENLNLFSEQTKKENIKAPESEVVQTKVEENKKEIVTKNQKLELPPKEMVVDKSKTLIEEEPPLAETNQPKYSL